jgi:tetratricopeptide (TPR) repeat protein
MAAALVVAPLYDRAFLTDSWRQVWRKRWGFYAACAASVLILAAVVAHQSATRDQMYGGFGQVGVRWWQYLASQGGVILHYLRLAVWPDALCLDYDWPVAKGWVAIGLPSAIVLVLLSGSLWLWRVAPGLGWVALAFFLILAPTSSFMPIIDLAVEHRMYLPLASLMALSVLLADRCLRHRWTSDQRRAWISAAILASLVLALIARTLLRNRDYRDPVIMWRSVVAQAPHNYKAYYNLGVALARKRHTDAAIQAYQQALRLRPRYTDARYNLALQYDALGQLAQAQHHYLVLLRIDPHDAAARFNLAGIYHRQGCQQEAIWHYRQALRDEPNHLRARGNLASLMAERGEYAEARQELETAIRQAPNKAWLYDNYGNLYARQGRLEAAIQQYDRALQAQPNYPAAYLHKARALGRLGRRGDAIAVLHTVQQRFGPTEAASRLLAELQSESVVDGCEGNCPLSISGSAGGQP